MPLVVRRHRSSPLLPVVALAAVVTVVLLAVGVPGCGGAQPDAESEAANPGGANSAGANPAGAGSDPSPSSGSAGLGLAVPTPSPSAASSPAAAKTGKAPAAAPKSERGDDPNDEASDSPLVASIETIIANAIQRAGKESKGKAGPSNCAVSLMAVDLESGKVLMRRMAELPLVPASNLKLLTAAAALAGLGPTGEFQTPFEAVGEIRDGILEGDLVARAGGDPLYSSEGDGGLDPWLAPLAASLKKAGIDRVAGALVLDEGSWLEPGPAVEWPAASDHWQKYCALAGGFTANGGSFRATVTPLPDRGKVDVTLRPKSHGLKRRGSVSLGQRNAVNVGANKNGVTVRGTIPGSSAPLVSEFSAPDPVDLFGHAAVGWLARHGIVVEGGFVRSRHWEAKGQRIHTIRTPITEVLKPILQDSHNAVADQLFLALGHQTEGAGSRKAAAKAVRNALEQIGVPSEGLVQVDGSGLSKANRTNCIQLTALVAAVLQTGGPMADAFLEALPVSGESGSLRKRMRGMSSAGRVRAKTGWVSGSSSLSGVATTLGGRRVVFSILVSYPKVSGLNTKAWKPMQDEICTALVEWAPDVAPGKKQ